MSTNKVDFEIVIDCETKHLDRMNYIKTIKTEIITAFEKDLTK